jgi:hypothetical protein
VLRQKNGADTLYTLHTKAGSQARPTPDQRVAAARRVATSRSNDSITYTVYDLLGLMVSSASI